MNNDISLFANNFVLNAVEDNYSMALDVYKAHNDRLYAGVSQAGIQPLYDDFNPLWDNYNNAYTLVQTLKNQGQGNTQLVTDRMAELRVKIRLWDISIQVVYDQTSTEYKALLPNRRGPFQTGTYQAKLNAVATLHAALDGIAPLAAIRTQVGAFLALMQAALGGQAASSTEVQNALTALDAALLAAGKQVFKNYGSLVVLYFQNPTVIATYVPFDKLSRKTQTEFTGTLQPGMAHRVLKRKMNNAEDLLELTNAGDSNLEWYFNNGMNDAPAPGVPPHVQPAMSQEEKTPDSLGYTDDRRSLWVRNTGLVQASWAVAVE